MKEPSSPQRHYPPNPSPPSDTDSGSVWAWYAEFQRAALLLETLAEDHFPDQAAFEAWIQRQQEINLRRTPHA